MKRNRLLAICVFGLLVGALTLSGAGYSKAGRATVGITPAPPFTAADLSSIGANWVEPEGDLEGDGYSTLNQINTSNVSTLKTAWTKNVLDPNCNATISTSCGTAEDNGLVYKGVYYLENMYGSVFAMDATTGDTIWTYEAPAGARAGTFRGIAMGNGLIYASQTDGDIVALRMADGSVYWDTNVGPTSSGYREDGGLSYLNYHGNNMVFMGESGGDTGVSDYVTALNANTGQLIWRFNVIPTPGSPGYDTWASPINWQDGGGSVWETQMALDPKLGLLYASTGNPIPWNYTGPGTELYTESVVAMNLATGKLQWYYQTVHHDIWDNDMMNGPELFNAKFRPYKIIDPGSLIPSYTAGGNGQPVGLKVKYTGPAVEQPALSVATKMGYLFILNRQTGKPLIPTPEEKYPTEAALDEWPTQPVPVGDKWAGQCFNTPADEAQWGPTAPDGNPYTFGCTFSPYDDTGYIVTPHDTADWPTMSVDPNTATEYVCGSNDRGGAIISDPQAVNIAETGLVKQGEGAHQQTSPSASAAALPGGGNHYLGEVVAVNLTTNKFLWRTYLPPVAINPATDQQLSTVKTGPCYSGLTSTAGGLVFVGLNDGTIQAIDAKTGNALWTSPHPAGGTGDGGCNDKPIVYQGADGKEYVSIYCGGDGHEGVQAGNLIQTFALPS